MKRIQNVLALVSLLFISLGVNGQVDRSKAPEPGPAPNVNIKEPLIRKLPNGMTLLLVRDDKVPMVTMQFKLDIEPIAEGDLAGLSSMAGEMLRSGTRKMRKEDLDERIDLLGASVYTYSDGFYASCLSKNAEDLMVLLYQMTTDPTFPPAEFEKVKKKEISSLAASENDPSAISARVGDVLRFKKGHPYGQLATAETVEKIMRKHVKAYYDHYFKPENAYLVIVGDATIGDLQSAATKTFGVWQPAQDPKSIAERKDADRFISEMPSITSIEKYPAPPRSNQVYIVDRPDADQSVIDVTYPVILTPNDPNALVAQVMNGILGGGAFNARLNQNLREDKAYTYGAFSRLNSDLYIGDFSAGASVRTSATDSAIAEILYEMQRMKDEEVTDEELTLTKSMMAGSFARSLEDPRTTARFALNTILYGLDKDHYRTWLQRLDTISPSSVLSMSRNYLKPQTSNILIVGNKEEVENSVSKFAKRGGVAILDKYGERFREVVKPPTEGMTADQVIDDYLMAIGGKAKLASRKSEVIQMTTTVNGLDVDYVSYRKYPNKYMARMTANGTQLQKVVYDGKVGERSEMGEAGMLMDVELAELSYEADMNFNMKYKQLSFDVRLFGTTTVNGKEAYKISVVTDSGNMFEEYYDTVTKLKLKKVERKGTSSGQQVITTYYDDYAEVSGILYPHTITKNAESKMVFKVTSIELDKELDDSLFAPY